MHSIDAQPRTLIDLLRHGTPEGGSRYRGHRDDPLAEQGWAEMWAAVGRDWPWTRLVSSPLTRCRAFAEALAERSGLPLSLEPDLREIGFGDWEGRAVAEVREREGPSLARYWADPVKHPPANGEPLPDFQRRVAAVWERLTRDHPGEHLLLIAHGGVIRMVLAQVLGMPLRGVLQIEVPVAGMTRLRVQPDINGRPLTSLLFHAR